MVQGDGARRARRELRDARLDLAPRLAREADLARRPERDEPVARAARRRRPTGRFGPPWAAPVYDARIFNFEGTLFSSQVCKACDFSVTQLRLAAEPTADGGVANLQAWATRRFVVREGWAAGRNQALFVHTESTTVGASLRPARSGGDFCHSAVQLYGPAYAAVSATSE